MLWEGCHRLFRIYRDVSLLLDRRDAHGMDGWKPNQTINTVLLTISNYRMISSAINEKVTSHKKERIIFFVKNTSKLWENFSDQ